ncbi:MAG: sugar ABC transporter permease [Chloroflexi bacterium]|nr:sugar ABC transporter permease [Chloroflexota bacterium]
MAAPETVIVAAAEDRAQAVVGPRTAARWDRRALHAYLLLLPSLVFLIPFTIWPALRVIYTSLFLVDISHPNPTFIGLGNFVAEFTNPIFLQVLRNTAIYTLGTVPISVVLALLLAIEVNKRLKLSGFFRTALFYPTILPTVGAAAIWLFIYVPSFGLIDRFLSVFGVGSHNWLGDPGLVLPALMLIMIWKQTGYFMVFYLAGLQSLPQSVFEAAELDGAGGWRSLISLTVPLLSGTTVFVTTVAFVDSFQTVDQLFILTQGGPNNSSSLLLYWLYIEGFHNFNVGRASAVTVVMIVIVLAVSLFNFRFQDREAHYES